MKKIFLIVAILSLIGCKKENIPVALDRQSEPPKSEEYYANLRAYKKTDHQKAFGWFGHWNPLTTSGAGRLSNAPDSMDIISIWGGWGNLTPEKIADKKFVQEVKGTKVTFTFIIHGLGDGINGDRSFWPDDDYDAIRAYAKAIGDTAIKYDYDGFDWDYEPNHCGCTPWFLQQDRFELMVKELGKYFGPKSGTHRTLKMDGTLAQSARTRSNLTPELVEYFDYFVEQAYASGSSSATPATYQARYDGAAGHFRPDQFFLTENFESYAATGGLVYTDPVRGTMPTLLGMAYWQPRQGRKAGIGTYHMQYEYVNNPDYKYIRQAIQIMNPAIK